MAKIIAEYIWLDNKLSLRSKTKIIYLKTGDFCDDRGEPDFFNTNNYPIWNFDGSSTGQASGLHSELYIKPVAVYRNPFFSHEKNANLHFVLVLCETLDKELKPLPSNTYSNAKKIFDKKMETTPWFGIEQEYFILCEEDIDIISNGVEQGPFYCGVGAHKAIHREIAQEHMLRCIDAGLNISGINAEVAPCQWEYQIGPCTGIEAANQLWISRWILLRISEKSDYLIEFSPKPFENLNGSGCHTNFSTKIMRDSDDGLSSIFDAIRKLSKNHKEHMKMYGDGNKKRMSGDYETSNYNVFSFDKNKPVDRGASIRIGYDTMKNKKGYFEDRRPASNMDPYKVTSAIFKTISL